MIQSCIKNNETKLFRLIDKAPTKLAGVWLWAGLTSFIVWAPQAVASSGSPAIAESPGINRSGDRLDSQESEDQVTSVSQLSDVKPTDWAFQALQSLVERYGCIVGYPDKTYRGNRALSRYEFAAGLNACLDKIQELIAAGTANFATKQDLEALKKMMEEFAPELAALRGRVESLEVRTATLEKQQFSTTTRLNILTSFNLSRAFAAGDVKAEGIPIPGSFPTARFGTRFLNPFTGEVAPIVTQTTRNPETTLSYSSYLILTSSFTGKDTLTTILAAGNGNPPASSFSSAGFASTFGVPYADSNPVNPLAPSSVGLFEAKYSFPIGDAVNVVVGPRILPFRHVDQNLYTNVVTGASGLNSYQSTLANGGLSGAGAIVSWNITPQIVFQGGYLARNDASLQFFGPDSPSNPSRGLFNGTYSWLAELAYSPIPELTLRFLYTRAHIQAPPAAPPFQPNFPFFLTNSLRGVVDDGFGGSINDVDSDNFVFNFDWTIAPSFALFGRYSYSRSGIDPINPLIRDGVVRVQAFQLGLAFPDLGKKGALGTISVVAPFDVLEGRRFLVAGYGNGGMEINVEASYFFPITPNVALVPMFFTTFNANNFSDNPTVFSAVLRTQFLF
ncbi:MAG: iron uptake porin [Leptolyngbyaceae cyanobacterium bins.302]|nr:iron uptake porin [Leptolyngbyaceae cyanobacterium bins.302]